MACIVDIFTSPQLSGSPAPPLLIDKTEHLHVSQLYFPVFENLIPMSITKFHANRKIS